MVFLVCGKTNILGLFFARGKNDMTRRCKMNVFLTSIVFSLCFLMAGCKALEKGAFQGDRGLTMSENNVAASELLRYICWATDHESAVLGQNIFVWKQDVPSLVEVPLSEHAFREDRKVIVAIFQSYGFTSIQLDVKRQLLYANGSIELFIRLCKSFGKTELLDMQRVYQCTPQLTIPHKRDRVISHFHVKDYSIHDVLRLYCDRINAGRSSSDYFQYEVLAPKGIIWRPNDERRWTPIFLHKKLGITPTN